MTKEKQNLYLGQAFDAFCKKVIRNAAFSIHRELKRRREREISISELSDRELESICVMDNYCLYSKEFIVLNETVVIHDPDLGDALQFIKPQLRNIVLMRYFLDMSNTEIAKKLNISNSTVAYRIDVALKQLRKQIESINDIKPT